MGRIPAFSLKAALLALAASQLSACSVSPDAAKMFNEKLGPLLGVTLHVAASSKNVGSAKDVSSAQKPTTDAALPDNRAVNADFIREMTSVVLLRDLRSREEFERAMNALDQGGHYEGLYNGLIYAAEYREKEKGVAPAGALRAYTEIMSQLMLDEKYDPLKLAAPDETAAPAGESAAPPQPTNAERIMIQGNLVREAITKSTFWLKRRLGEETLKTIDLKKEYREKLATWYARFTVALNKRGVDFGLPLRNKTDEYFHYKWALDADEDRLKWECLNRVHRVINAAAGLREPAPATKTVPVQAAPASK